MSGRTFTGLRSDGKPKFGFRKTAREVLRCRTPAEMPEQTLTFTLPATLDFALAPGPVAGLIGVKVLDSGKVEVTGRDRNWICGQAAALIKRLGKGRPGGRVLAAWTRDDERQEFEIVWASGEPAVIISGYSMRPFFAEGR